MGHTGVTDASAAGADEERLRAVLSGLRSVAGSEDPSWRPRHADARAIVDGAWQALADLLDDKPHAGAVLELLRRLSLADAAMVRAEPPSGALGEVIARLESAPPSVAALLDLGPQLTRHLGFDRAILSRVVDGVWISQSVFIADDPRWAAEINRVGQEMPQPLVPGLYETEIVRRREAMIVTDVQRDSRVHRPIADASRSQSYVAAPIVSGNQVVGFLHADCYLQGRDPGAGDCAALAAYAKGLQLALSRAHATEQLTSVGSHLRRIANECHDSVDAVGEFSLGHPAETTAAAAFPLAARVTRRALRSVRGALTAREAQVLELMAEGRSNAAIAAKLVISEGTVKQHVKHVLRKLGATNRVEAVSMLYQSDGV